MTCIRADADPVLIHNNRARLIHEEENLKKLAGIFYLTGNEVRLKLLYLIFHESKLCVCDLSDILEMKIPAISQHLRKLKDLKLVKTQRKGQTIYYHINEEYHYYFDTFFNRLLRYKP
ncbi:MAG: winged helix-turn-helix transcriptional regulator [Bacteroidales bacterium]|nr:winged helix-turn-helix transcriptional regulator [Bacteroidales bacterium]